jgi:hypothetical protein
MKAATVAFAAAAAGLLVLWVLNLIRGGRLYVGYGVALIVGVPMACAITLAAWPDRTTGEAGGLPVAAILLAGLLAGGFILAYVFSQLTIVANRVAQVVQELAIERAGAWSDPGRPGGDFLSPDGRGTIDQGRPAGRPDTQDQG